MSGKLSRRLLYAYALCGGLKDIVIFCRIYLQEA